uniref:C-type lectin domain-containing protein n=1 Tax=Terrapene triunguis TaxID=2587831 RepID=A0A674IMM4_9SAUR
MAISQDGWAGLISGGSICVKFLLLRVALRLGFDPPCSPAVSRCPDGWVGYLGKCYYFSEAEGNWDFSQSNCSSFGASLFPHLSYRDRTTLFICLVSSLGQGLSLPACLCSARHNGALISAGAGTTPDVPSCHVPAQPLPSSSLCSSPSLPLSLSCLFPPRGTVYTESYPDWPLGVTAVPHSPI